MTQTFYTDPVRNRQYYMDVVPLDTIKIEEKYLVRPLDEKHKDNLKHQIRDQGLIEPLTLVREDNGTLVLLAGKHRRAALNELGQKDVPAKIYVNLDETSRRLIGYMSNEARKRPSAGKRFEALEDIFVGKFDELQVGLSKPPSEQQVLDRMYVGTTKVRVSEVILGMTVDKLRKDTSSLVYKYDLIQDAQVPRKVLVQNLSNGKYTFFTAQNIYTALARLCRSTPVTTKEDEATPTRNFRSQEYQNVKKLFDGIVEMLIKPWVSVNAIDAAVAFAKGHPFQAFADVVATDLVAMGLPRVSPTEAPLYHDKTMDFNVLFSKLASLKDQNLWTTPMISQERSVDTLVNRINHFRANGVLPPF